MCKELPLHSGDDVGIPHAAFKIQMSCLICLVSLVEPGYKFFSRELHCNCHTRVLIFVPRLFIEAQFVSVAANGEDYGLHS